MVVNSLGDSPSYIIDNQYSSNVNFFNPINLGLEVMRKYFSNGGADWLNHGMVETYLSNRLYAKEVGSNAFSSKKMNEIFTDKLISLADTLEENCEAPKLKFSVQGGIETGPNSFTIPSAGPSVSAKISVIDTSVYGEDTEFEIKYYKYSYTPTVYPFNNFNEMITHGNSVTIQFPFADRSNGISVKAYNPITGKTTWDSPSIKIGSNSPPSISPSVRCYLSATEDGVPTYGGNGDVVVNIKDNDSLSIFIGAIYPDVNGSFEGQSLYGSGEEPNFIFNERDDLRAYYFTRDIDSIQIVYGNNYYDASTITVSNTCK